MQVLHPFVGSFKNALLKSRPVVSSRPLFYSTVVETPAQTSCTPTYSPVGRSLAQFRSVALSLVQANSPRIASMFKTVSTMTEAKL